MICNICYLDVNIEKIWIYDCDHKFCVLCKPYIIGSFLGTSYMNKDIEITKVCDICDYESEEIIYFHKNHYRSYGNMSYVSTIDGRPVGTIDVKTLEHNIICNFSYTELDNIMLKLDNDSNKNIRVKLQNEYNKKIGIKDDILNYSFFSKIKNFISGYFN